MDLFVIFNFFRSTTEADLTQLNRLDRQAVRKAWIKILNHYFKLANSTWQAFEYNISAKLAREWGGNSYIIKFKRGNYIATYRDLDPETKNIIDVVSKSVNIDKYVSLKIDTPKLNEDLKNTNNFEEVLKKTQRKKL